MIYIVPAIYLVSTIAHAWYHAYLIEEKNKLITSTKKIFEWGFVSFISFWALITWSEALPLIILPIVTRLAFFDSILNWWRGENWLYEGTISKKKSIWDYIENKLGLPIWVYRFFYIAIYIVYLLTYFNVI